MKKGLKIVLIIIGVIVGIILLDSIQALVFDNNPIIGIQTRNMKKVGILVDTHHCGNGKHDTVIKGFSYSCNYEGGKYTLVDETKKINDFTCAEALEGFYEDENYTYYWSCIKNKYMIVKYDDGSKELISEALNNNHIDIQVLDKFNIDYIKIEQEKLKEDIKFNIIETKNCNFRLNEYYKNNDRTIYTSCLDEIYVIRPNSDAVVTLKYYLENVYQTLDDSIKQLVKNATIDKELKDGGTKIYKKDNYTVILCNTVDGIKDIYIGDSNMKHKENFCKANNYTFVKTYTILYIEEYTEQQYENGIPVTYGISHQVKLKDFNGEEHTVILNNIWDKLEKNKTYEFEFRFYEYLTDVKDDVQYIFKNSYIVEIRETSKDINNQINEKIYID